MDDPRITRAQNASTQRWIGIIGLFIAPTTVITSLCYYFGAAYTRRNLGYFGVDANAIGFSTSDYVLRSVTVLYAPIIGCLLAWLAVWCAGFYLRRLAQAGRRTRLLAYVGWAAVAVGGIAVVRGLDGMTLPQYVWPRGAAWTALGVGVGGVVLLLGTWLLATLRTAATAEPFSPVWRAALAAGVGLTILGLFWVTGNLATRYGEEQARATQSRLWSQETAVIVDTTERLNAPSQLVAEAAIDSAEPGRGIQFRYFCFRTLVVKGDRWVLVPAAWEPKHGYVLMLDAGTGTRIWFTKHANIADTPAADWSGDWPCPEVGAGQ
jgi:hypothetical protein